MPESTIDARPLFEDNTVVFCVTMNQAAKERLTDYRRSSALGSARCFTNG